jgi:pyruvate formate-lyase activating enzyme-like uncharacterized protein
MIIGINSKTLTQIRNPELRAYAARYVDIYSDYMQQVEGVGIHIDPLDDTDEVRSRLDALQKQGAILRNNDKSIYLNRISPGCEACQTGLGSATFFVSLKCHRSCYYCFNPNQEGYDYYREHTRDLKQELEVIAGKGQKVKHLALTGGEPLLHKTEAVEFFATASQKFPTAYKRLYTCGDYVDEDILGELQRAGLQEIRFSIRMHDLEKGHRQVFERILLAKKFIPNVMVEMPVLPGTLDIMQEVLLELERLQIHSINLLEFCFPYSNVEQFNLKGYAIKSRPYKILYEYWYAGGLPVARSEQVCLDLLDFAIQRGLTIGVHYCSLENKHTGQVYQQNQAQRAPKHTIFSQKDYFLKTAKVFGDDISKTLRVFKKIDYKEFHHDQERNYLEFSVRKVKTLQKLDAEVGISSSVLEKRGEETFLRELCVDYTTPEWFDPIRDI